MKVNIFYSVVLAIFLTADYGCTQNSLIPDSPCPQYFRYAIDNQGNLYATIDVPSSGGKDNITMAVNMTYPYTPESYNYGPLSLDWNMNISEVCRRIINYEPLQYRVDFSHKNPLPKLTYLFYNGEIICVGGPDSGQVEERSIFHMTYFPVSAFTQIPVIPQQSSPRPNTQHLQPSSPRPNTQVFVPEITILSSPGNSPKAQGPVKNSLNGLN